MPQLPAKISKKKGNARVLTSKEYLQIIEEKEKKKKEQAELKQRRKLERELKAKEREEKKKAKERKKEECCQGRKRQLTGRTWRQTRRQREAETEGPEVQGLDVSNSEEHVPCKYRQICCDKYFYVACVILRYKHED